jgi:hypothetical protein
LMVIASRFLMLVYFDASGVLLRLARTEFRST